MIKDELTAWDGAFPYDPLAVVGITPYSSRAEVEDASFPLMAKRLLGPATQRAWNELRDQRTRLLADLLLYELDPAEIGQARERVRAEQADLGSPPWVADALVYPKDDLSGLAEEVAEVTLAPRPVALDPEIAAFPPRSLIDRLTDLDR